MRSLDDPGAGALPLKSASSSRILRKMSAAHRDSHGLLRAKVESSGRLCTLLLFFVLASCVTEDVNTGKMIPRGQQGMQFSDVEKAAESLKDGMTRAQVMLMLGSPAERSDDGNVWVYLPERYAILIPALALRLEFKDGLLDNHGYRPIVLGVRF
jgi:hypothetical protein